MQQRTAQVESPAESKGHVAVAWRRRAGACEAGFVRSVRSHSPRSCIALASASASLSGATRDRSQDSSSVGSVDRDERPGRVVWVYNRISVLVAFIDHHDADLHRVPLVVLNAEALQAHEFERSDFSPGMLLTRETRLRHSSPPESSRALWTVSVGLHDSQDIGVDRQLVNPHPADEMYAIVLDEGPEELPPPNSHGRVTECRSSPESVRLAAHVAGTAPAACPFRLDSGGPR